uniref:Bcl-2-associated transcription factor 1 isoform X1 n=1 Tax=Geotrypetes seraphini TaxID=260995 RepID=A0A6P8QZY7_GEOSA|nr:bcl-2-associated transcription factor 1 isoform X1 [Geotrypetes seraphini]XP_033792052.1 bcl-2-associated transcription factor 1 isoform X1 [Geotrypetes seraphini]
MGRSNTRSHSSRSKSRSQSSSRSRSRSHSKKKRYSSRSRSRTYSRSRSRDRIYNRDNRDYRRDYRNNRGMRRPFIYRGRGRGYYHQGGGRYFRGGYRPMWNRRHSRSPRRGRSHSRSPKRRSMSSQRSRSRSHRSYRSSRSPRTSSSRSSSPYSKSPVPSKKRGSLEKQGKKTDGGASHHSPLNSKSQNEQKDAFEHDASESLDELNKTAVHGDSWTGLSTYDNSPRSPLSPSVASPSSLSSRSDVPLLSTVHSGKNTSPHSRQRSPERSDSGSLENGSARYSPSQNSPLHHIPSRRSPAKTMPSQSAPREESRIRSSLYCSAGDQEVTKGGKFLKRYTDEENRVHLLDRGNREKETQKERGEKSKKEGEKEWEAKEAAGCLGDKDANKHSFLSVSEGEDLEETEDYRQFRKSVLADQGKNFASASHWNTEEEGAKYKSKVSRKGSRESDKSKEDKSYKAKEPSYALEKTSTTKDKYKQEDKISERIMVKQEIQSTDQVNSEKLKELFNYSPPLHKSLESREKSTFREESPLRIRMIATESQRPEVKLKMTEVPLDDTIGPTLANDRLLASTLVHSVKKEQEFRSIFDHIKVPHASKSSSESFIQHIVSLVHQVKEHYFKSAVGMTLNQRFTDYQQATKDPSTRPKSPEIHRRIDISPSALRKHTRVLGEEKSFKEESQKQADKKLRVDSADRRHDIDRRRKGRSKERGDSKGSRESSGSRKQEKHQKDYKEYKSYKDESKRKREHDRSRSSSSSSLSSREEKDSKKERDDDFKTHHEQKEFTGFAGINRPRGAFQFRIRGRGRARGIFAGTNTGPSNSNTTFQKRPKEEEWDPEYTPKSKKYFLHDDRDDGVDYWVKRGRGRGTFQRGRGRFTFKKSGSSPKWTHDKYQGDGLFEDEDEAMENNEERKDRRKEAKVENSGLSVK